MIEEPYRLIRWKPKEPPFVGQFFTCARPGRSKDAKAKISDELVDIWVRGLPASQEVFIVSLLGRKPEPDNRSEFSFYSFRGGFDQPSDRPDCPTFQEWLNERYGNGRYCVLEFPTVDTKPLAPETINEVSAMILSLLHEDRTVVLMDSGGIGRTGKVRKCLGFIQDK